MEKEPLTIEYGLREGDERAVFPAINRTGERLILVPAHLFEVITTTQNSIVLRDKTEQPPF